MREEVERHREAILERRLDGPVDGQRVFEKRDDRLDVDVQQLVADAEGDEREDGAVHVPARDECSR